MGRNRVEDENYGFIPQYDDGNTLGKPDYYEVVPPLIPDNEELKIAEKGVKRREQIIGFTSDGTKRTEPLGWRNESI